MQGQLRESLLKLSAVLILCLLKLIESLLISIHLISVVLLSSFHFDLMCLRQVSESVLVSLFHLPLSFKQLLISLIVLNLLVLNIGV
jgi:hypothetical protein